MAHDADRRQLGPPRPGALVQARFRRPPAGWRRDDQGRHPASGGLPAASEGPGRGRRFGYRRIEVLLQREGWRVNHKRVRRLYGEMGLQLRNKSPKRRVKAKLREDRTVATAANQVWAMDFVHDQLFDGRKIRILTIVDTFSRYAPAIDVRASFRGIDVVETLERISASLPSGPGVIDRWAGQRGSRRSPSSDSYTRLPAPTILSASSPA